MQIFISLFQWFDKIFSCGVAQLSILNPVSLAVSWMTSLLSLWRRATWEARGRPCCCWWWWRWWRASWLLTGVSGGEPGTGPTQGWALITSRQSRYCSSSSLQENIFHLLLLTDRATEPVHRCVQGGETEIKNEETDWWSWERKGEITAESWGNCQQLHHQSGWFTNIVSRCLKVDVLEPDTEKLPLPHQNWGYPE